MPALFLLIKAYQADRLEPEPPGLLLSLIFRGILATAVALVLEQLGSALLDFQFINALPGRKIILKGNHDYWWGTATKMNNFFQAHGIESIDILFNNCFFYGDYALCGTRGWFYEEDAAGTHTGKMLAREALRLETSLKAAGERPILCFLHYPPLYQGYQCPEMLELIDRYGVERCYHGPTHRRAFEGRRGKTDYALISADYLGFIPKKICD